MSTTTKPRNAAGRKDITTLLAKHFRFWARLPQDVKAILFLGDPARGRASVLAAIGRPEFGAGVCSGCGCTEFDACVSLDGETCAWRDDTRTRCTACRPASRKAAKRR